ncbi:hypothetical protein BLOT_003556 [Blomia tropicalis]|nr:hypothetical protein BLOT_003556 [Blomia tropicalis]
MSPDLMLDYIDLLALKNCYTVIALIKYGKSIEAAIASAADDDIDVAFISRRRVLFAHLISVDYDDDVGYETSKK